MPDDLTKCSARDCDKPARCAIDLVRYPKCKMTVFFDDREATKKALRYCHECGVKTVTEVSEVLVDGDD